MCRRNDRVVGADKIEHWDLDTRQIPDQRCRRHEADAGRDVFRARPQEFEAYILHRLDRAIVLPNSLKSALVSWHAGIAERLLIGVRNEAGDIYRLIGATKLNSYMNAVEELFDLGLADELENTEEPKEGCDAIFSEA